MESHTYRQTPCIQETIKPKRKNPVWETIFLFTHKTLEIG